MNAVQYVNLGIFGFSAVVLLIILLCVVTADYKKGELDRMYMVAVGILIPILGAEIAIYIAPGSGAAYAPFIFRASIILGYICTALLYICFSRFVYLFIKSKGGASKAAAYLYRGAAAVYMASILCAVLTIFNNMYFYVEDDFLFRPGKWMWLAYFVATAGFLLNTANISFNREKFKTGEMLFLLSFAVLPLLGQTTLHHHIGSLAVVNIAITLMLLMYYVGIQSKQAARLKQKELELIESRVNLMLSQIQPHFLYNTLNTIETLCYKDGDMAAELVRGFADYLRKNMEALTQKGPVRFTDELEHTKIYLEIEKLRFEERLAVEYDIEAADFWLPVLTVQPLAENAVHHGITRRPEGGTITIRSREDDDFWRVTVEDNGVGVDISKHNDIRAHVGISNVRERLKTQCGGMLTIESTSRGTICAILIPKRGGEA